MFDFLDRIRCELIFFLLGLFAFVCFLLGISRTKFGPWFGIAQAHFKGKFLLSAASYVPIVFVIYVGPIIVVAYAVNPLYFIHPILYVVVNQVVWLLIGSFVGGPLMAGLSLVALKQLKGEPWKFGDFFGGFRGQWYISIVGYSLAKGLIVYLPLGPGIFSKSPSLAGPLLLAGFLVMMCLRVRLGVFGELLILDRRFGAVDAIKGNWEMSKGRFVLLFVFVLVLGLLNWFGALLCGVGLLFSVPFTVLVTTAGYRLITGTEPPLANQPTFIHECPRCAQQVTVPASVDVIRIICPKCNHQWDWNYFEDDGLDLE